SGKTVGSAAGASGELHPDIPASALSVMIQMHGVTIDADDPLARKSQLREWLPHKTIRDAARHYATAFLPELVRRANIKTPPQLQRVLGWLEKNVPDSDEAPVVIHGDYGYHNILFDDNRVSAVLDWEMGRLGDPAEDIVWTQQNLGAYSMPEFLAK